MSIGFLVVALITGGLLRQDRITNLVNPPASVEASAPQPEPEPGLDVVANQLLDSVAQLTEGVEHSVAGLIPISAVDDAWVTHYGESFNGQALGCDATPYASDNASIVAVGASRDAEWPCGTILRVCGPGGCLVAQRADGCPGCGPYHVDLSEEGLLLVCGPGSGVCQARVEAFRVACEMPVARRRASQDSPLELFATLAEIALGDRTADMLDLTQDEPRGDVCTVRGPGAPLPQQP
ncbi:MAG TPA: hypothetical protein VFS30_18085 [Dehalococcoidia bacterium]|nr:hypothetical protein [Dehalococcoidia bacterium]